MGFFKSFERSIRPKRVFKNVGRFLDKEVGIDDPGVRKAVIIAGSAILGGGIGSAFAGGAAAAGLSAAQGAGLVGAGATATATLGGVSGATLGALAGSTVAISGLTPREEGANLLPVLHPSPETVSRRFASGGLLGLRRLRGGRSRSGATGGRGLLRPANIRKASLLDTLG
jgi:hypothetical protein|tara:strand:- start:4049 stop:4561 length:513 start_codon:yes stop_codon:yes gene_type:complete